MHHALISCVMNSNWIGVVTNDTASSTDMNTLHSAILTRCSIKRRRICAAHWLWPPPQLDVARVLCHDVSPHVTPRVLDEPVVTINGICPISNQKYGVVDSDVLIIVTAIKNTSKIQTPVTSGHRGCQRSLTMQCIDYFLPFCNKPTHHQIGPQTGEHYFQTGLLELSPPEKEFSDEDVLIIHHLTEWVTDSVQSETLVVVIVKSQSGVREVTVGGNDNQNEMRRWPKSNGRMTKRMLLINMKVPSKNIR